MLQCIFRQCIIIGTVISDRWMVEVGGLVGQRSGQGNRVEWNGSGHKITDERAQRVDYIGGGVSVGGSIEN